MIHHQKVNTPLGELTIIANDKFIIELCFPKKFEGGSTARKTPLLTRAIKQIQEYCAAERQCFDLPLAATGTPFQQDVWAALERIPYGKTISYGELAKRIGRPKASRAVGAANGRNPIPIIIPCHRVIGQNGTLTGFGGGILLKQQLLDLECELFAGPR